MDVRYFILSLFFLISCMPTAQVGKTQLANSATTSGSASGGTTVTPTTLSWNFLGKLETFITINVSNLNNAYVVGTPVETYLSVPANFDNANYCLVSTYNVGGTRKELRSRMVPLSYFDFTSKRTVKNLRVDFQDVQNSSFFCSGGLKIQDTSTGLYIPDRTEVDDLDDRHYDSEELCENCTGMLDALSVRIFKKVSSSLEQVPLTSLNSDLLSMQVDPNYSEINNGGTCTNAGCVSRGFNCCLENQCVKDGGVKPAASSLYSSLLKTAEEERLQNPLAYLNYPQLYYICGSSIPPTTTGGSSGGTTGGSYDAAFELLKKDYTCIEHLKSKQTMTPFHNELLSRSWPEIENCLTDDSDEREEMYFKKVMIRLYNTCGCNRTDLQDMVNNCPAYEYTVVNRDTANAPTRIDCYTPPNTTIPVPLQQTVSVPSRSAPHRFFNVAGIEKPIATGVAQEGATFSYMDEGKVLPQQASLSMNAILGQMSVALDQALPAKTVAVDLDQIYFISTTSGYYTPCPTCAKDSWLSAFSAFPSSSTGSGLQAVGYTTERDAFSTNTTGGNYEDTIFGRACWLPPTMIPFSHVAKNDLNPEAPSAKEQRRNRLETQAALFNNGYQRDWFGFNKGALIGSFDGVSWFAIGKGRIVRSSSKKLFLAINAPFADLASPTTHMVRVHAYDGITQAAQVDYDPQYHQYHPYQNEAGNCQRYHFCSTDTDCVTNLGWEYACADVKDLKTNWPEFDSDGNELPNTSVSLSIDQILQQKKFPDSSTKRCVYRGAGAVCNVNSGSLAAGQLNKRKLLTCAPNFFCSAGSNFNTKIARYAAPLEDIPVSRNHLFGKDANILGRPENYIGSSVLSSTIKTTIADNLIPFEASANNYTGLCQPGKGLPTAQTQSTLGNPFNQQRGPDPLGRADYINQIGSCNSTLFTTSRHSSCPVIGSDGNYEMFSAETLPTGYAARATNQNSCGLESLVSNASLSSSADILSTLSAFKNIEAKPLNSQIILGATMVRDACLRRAGAACHTDLDCTPNKMHASQTDFLASGYFGNAAEKNYYTEYLVCGQADPKPFASNQVAYNAFRMNQNRCCREIGSDLTTYTADISQDTFVSGVKPYDPASAGLNMALIPGKEPNNKDRYSRLATVQGVGTLTSRPILTANIDRLGSGLQAKPNIMTPNQWQTISEANSETCCGGGWVRKFSDGSNDWSRRDRLVLDVTNFRCLNSRSIMITHPEDAKFDFNNSSTDAQNLATTDYGDYCKDATSTNGSCAQYAITDGIADTAPNDLVCNRYGEIVVNTIKPDYKANYNAGTCLTSNNLDNYFRPRSADANSGVIIDYNDTNTGARRNITIKIPSFVGRNFDNLLADPAFQNSVVRLELDTGVGHDCNTSAVNPTSPDTGYPAGPGAADCFYNYNSVTRILKVFANDAAIAGTFDKKKVGVRFKAFVAGSGTGVGAQKVPRTVPGTSGFYLRRLGRLELSGIPQIAHEMLQCNDNSNRILPGIFHPTIQKIDNFDDPTFSFLHSGKYFTTSHGLQHEPIFSANDFKCCSPLGKVTTNATKCCSGFGTAIAEGSNDKICSLPPGTNLMVYFNRFVTNEGTGTDKPGGGLIETDFEAQTGEPILSTTVNDKIRAMGVAYCSSGAVRQGGLLGSFEIEPQGSDTKISDRIYNFTDSTRDFGQASNAGATNTTGYTAFMDGFKWNHHLYCTDVEAN